MFVPVYCFAAPLRPGLAALDGCAPQPNVASSRAQAPPVGANREGVWCVRQAKDPVQGTSKQARREFARTARRSATFRKGLRFS